MCSFANFGDMIFSASAGAIFVLVGNQNVFLVGAILVVPAIISLIPIKSAKIK
jgi:hypothetical protein